MAKLMEMELRLGKFEDSEICGTRYMEGGDSAWLLNVLSHGSDEHLWLCRGEFRYVSGNTDLHETQFFIGATAPDLNPAMRKALIDLVAEWERNPKPPKRQRALMPRVPFDASEAKRIG